MFLDLEEKGIRSQHSFRASTEPPDKPSFQISNFVNGQLDSLSGLA